PPRSICRRSETVHRVEGAGARTSCAGAADRRRRRDGLSRILVCAGRASLRSPPDDILEENLFGWVKSFTFVLRLDATQQSVLSVAHGCTDTKSAALRRAAMRKVRKARQRLAYSITSSARWGRFISRKSDRSHWPVDCRESDRAPNVPANG